MANLHTSSILEDKPIKQDFERNLGEPFSLQDWLDRHREVIDMNGKKKLFEGFVSRIYILGKGVHGPDADIPETFLWQIEGKSDVKVNEKNYELLPNQTMLIPAGERYLLQADHKSRILSVVMNPV
ncbi:3-hydroxyanthranilate 3,4-dioxygenase [Trichonephila inaurata madagascariensis]|uniref:3-hydroxyanthranilate 3,4-dioxygenase n=1 Tax=Trichonephila inaurata madagascariensis TaxID=2747483 RepID=A0A8X7CQ53_9ARAC|nr:3-hydroxyanthranilate 3,4-dioxygenase [Trichonephila inaurata madagascariensis]